MRQRCGRSVQKLLDLRDCGLDGGFWKGSRMILRMVLVVFIVHVEEAIQEADSI